MPSQALTPTQPALPSGNAALAFVQGQQGALPAVVGYTLLRAGLIGVGLYVAGQRRYIVRHALVSSLAIEAFVLGWAVYSQNRTAPQV